MIKPTELRTGNLVSHVISGIHKYYYTTESELDRINPIPITAEILLDNGFENTYEATYSITLNGGTHIIDLIKTKDGWYPSITQPPEMRFQDDDCVSLNKIYYIHQLQNLIYVLSGKEWEVVI